MTLIVDAAPLVALGDRNDPRNASVRAVLESEPGDLVIPAPVTDEAGYLLRKRGGRGAARTFLRDFRTLRPLSGGAFHLCRPTAESGPRCAELR